MLEVVALFGLLMFYAALMWLPLVALRAVINRGPAQVWSIASILTFGLAFMGYTRAISTGNMVEGVAWSISWAMPVVLALYARSAPDAEFRRLDLWVGVAVVLTFILIVPLMPPLLRGAAQLIWGGP
jgi:hypothetical protein